jgi:type IV pilus assembly protein PilC
MKFFYQARTKEGEIRSGTIEASSREAALSILRKHGLYITFLKEEIKRPVFAKEIKIFKKKITTKDLVLFTRQLSIMFKSKIPLVEILRTLYNQTENPELKERIRKIGEEVEAGTHLSIAFSRHPDLFSPFYVSMLKSGEMSGKLSESLDYLANYLESRYSLTQTIKGALIYPVLILIMAILMAFFLSLFVLPQLKSVLMEANVELPIFTKIILNFGDFMKKFGWLLILALLALIFLIRRYQKTESGKKNFDKIIIKIPLIGPLSKMICQSRFAEDLATLISGGLPIADALKTTSDTVGNECYKEAILRAVEDVKRGETISYSLSFYPELFPPMFTEMVVVGEKTGKIEGALREISQFYQKEIERSVQNLISLIEPAMIVILGIGIGVIAVSIIMPLYKMISAF